MLSSSSEMPMLCSAEVLMMVLMPRHFEFVGVERAFEVGFIGDQKDGFAAF